MAVLGSAQTAFKKMADHQESSGAGVYHPFKDFEEWELAEWLVKNVNQRVTEDLLKLSIVSASIFWSPSLHDNLPLHCRFIPEHSPATQVTIDS